MVKNSSNQNKTHLEEKALIESKIKQKSSTKKKHSLISFRCFVETFWKMRKKLSFSKKKITIRARWKIIS